MNNPLHDPDPPSQGRAIGRIVLQDGRQTALFEDPVQVVAIYDPHDIEEALHLVTMMVEQMGYFAAGFLTYEAASAYDLAVHPPAPDGLPLLWFGLYRSRREIAVEALPAATYEVGPWRAALEWPAYEAAIAAIKRYIAAGHTYQVNYTMPLRATFRGDPWAFYRHLTQSQQADYMAFIDLGRYVICSSSPELFFHREGEDLLSKPMKGTARRGRTLEEDRQQMAWLQSSTKNRAENVMIVDMIRNDFGRIARIGTVEVPELFTVERYPTLLQMTSTVRAQSQAALPDIIRAMFPCASITGAPKVRTMEIIKELEPQPRGIYTGSIGTISPGQRAHFNVAIRTVVVDRHREEATYGVGGGIVWDSVAEQEYHECFLKAEVLVRRQPAFDLLETMRWDPEQGFALLDLHLRRLADSAEYFNYPLDAALVRARLNLLAQTLLEPTRVRLLVDKAGAITLETTALPALATSRALRTMLASNPVSADNIWLFHKTTHRTVYQQALAGRPEAEEVILWNTSGELTEATTSNIVLDLDGQLVTPPVSSGLLNGTFRQHLLDDGQICERRLVLEDLYHCRALYLINSVRFWQEAEFIDLGKLP